ncbi:FG-GAP-like repeat-containing protein [Flavobacterium cerinum]|uniref:FG-GAP-like repeat-containing protein n=1 Tax=Flavobacterium cerinum TaxID=2502784 RepID=A0ABY5IWN6_9FLAO|nr:FG-GAP-like repeat-containing protein [Flavobacterium cerinum]UUC47251.1 FG-GAP-like repeat-containing protein [Flavobacterium cerinum]
MKKITLLLFLLGYVNLHAQNTCGTALAIGAGQYTVPFIDGTGVPSQTCVPGSPSLGTAFEWYSYTPTGNFSVTVSTDLPASNGRDTRIHVYKGSCGAITCVTGDDDSGNGSTSVASFSAFQGNTYYIVFDNKWDAIGFDFSLTEQPYIAPLISFTVQPQSLAGFSYKNCVVDMNGDYLDDIVAVGNNQMRILYQSANGTYTGTTFPLSGVSHLPSWSIAAGDLDKNGYNDLIFGGGNGATFVKSNADGSAYIAQSFSQYIFCQRTNFIDFNNDGHLDIFVCHDVNPNVIFINDGNNNLTYRQGGLGDHLQGGNYGSIWVDYDNDGDSDLFIAKCRGGNISASINELHRNDGNGVFTNVSAQAGLADPIQTWSSAWGDFDNDGDMDVFVGASSNTNGMHKLMRNNGDGTFTDITSTTGIPALTSLGQENVAHDFNNDGYIDIFGPGNTILFNNGNMTFTKQALGGISNGPIGDLNNDGFLDIHNGDNIYLNTPNANKWLKLSLKGIQSNANGIGARVEIYGPWGKQIRDVRSGDGFRNMSSLNVHFGLGNAVKADLVVIKWPSGIVDTYTNVNQNQHLVVVEGNTLSTTDHNKEQFAIYPNPSRDFIKIQFSDPSVIASKAIFYDVTGRISLSTTIDADVIDVRSLSQGTYILNIESSTGEKLSTKFIKN